MTILGLPIEAHVNDDPRTKWMRTALGALHGFLGGTSLVVVSIFIDIWLYPDLPLGVDWPLFAVRWPVFALGLALVGAATSWWKESWPGLASGAVVTSLIALATALYSSEVGSGIKIMVLIFALIPFAVLSLPVAWYLRWLVEKHSHVSDRAYPRIAGLILITIVLGATTGFFMKMPERALSATRFVNTLLQTASDGKNPIYKVKGASEHVDSKYKLYQSASKFSTEGFNIRAEYEDGYEVTCEIVLYPGRDPYLSSCKSVP